MKSWLQDNYNEIYSTHNKGKFALAERFTKSFYKIKQNLYISDFSIKKCVY